MCCHTGRRQNKTELNIAAMATTKRQNKKVCEAAMANTERQTQVYCGAGTVYPLLITSNFGRSVMPTLENKISRLRKIFAPSQCSQCCNKKI